MKKLYTIIVLFLLTVNLFSNTAVQAASVLNIVNRIDETTQLQIFLHFDHRPSFTIETTGRRVNVELEDTVVAETINEIITDERMIRMVSRQQGTSTVLSFYFRYPPQRVTTESREETGMLMLDIVPGNPLSARYPELSAQFNGVTVLSRRTSDSLNPLNISPYVHDWKSFFTLHESPVTITPPPRLGLPPFPLAAAMPPEIAIDQWLSPEIKGLADATRWQEAYRLLRVQLTEQPDESLKERILLTYAETLVRAEEYREPYVLLQSIAREYPDTPMATLAQLLFTYLEADNGDLFSAAHELETLCRQMEDASLFPTHCTMLLAETTLASGRPADANAILAKMDVGNDPQLYDRRLLRRADLLYDANDIAAALTAYRELSEHQPKLVHTDPMSLARFTDVLYREQHYREAGENYRILGELLIDKPYQDLALFREAISQLRFPETERRGRIGLVQIQDAFPQAEGGQRALLKQTDLDYASGRIDAAAASAAYSRLGQEAGTVALREEASFKLALVNALAGNHRESVEQCMDLLRGFQSGALRTETMALLFQQLPGVIRRLVHDQEYIQALALAMQNRTYFARGWLDTGLLYDIVEAYSALGLITETIQTYQYLFEISLPIEAEQLYLPFIRTLSLAGQHVRAEEFADRYFLRHPQGNDGPAIFLLKVHALFASGRDEQAIRLLESDHRLHTPQLRLLGARIYFSRQQWIQVIDILTDPDLESFLTINEPLFFLAESYFQTGQATRAAPLFRQLTTQENGSEQAKFRLAQIAAQHENQQEALNLFEELAEKGTDPLWTGLAREQAAILQLQR
jgi:tetratricopeptide (TPR) repeat protein